jgi:hypothetical protein
MTHTVCRARAAFAAAICPGWVQLFPGFRRNHRLGFGTRELLSFCHSGSYWLPTPGDELWNYVSFPVKAKHEVGLTGRLRLNGISGIV